MPAGADGPAGTSASEALDARDSSVCVKRADNVHLLIPELLVQACLL